MSRAYTEEEIREHFLSHVRMLVHYWHKESRAQDTLDKLEGLAFSIMSTIDGSSALPAFKLIPNPHPEDKAYHIENEENFYPDDIDIAGCLHDQILRKDK